MHPVNLVVFDFGCVAQAITGENINLIIKRKCQRNLEVQTKEKVKNLKKIIIKLHKT